MDETETGEHRLLLAMHEGFSRPACVASSGPPGRLEPNRNSPSTGSRSIQILQQNVSPPRQLVFAPVRDVLLDGQSRLVRHAVERALDTRQVGVRLLKAPQFSGDFIRHTRWSARSAHPAPAHRCSER